MAKAYGELVDVLGGPQAFLQYRMLESGTYERLADANGRAISGLQPKITTWNTGGKYCWQASLLQSAEKLSRILTSNQTMETVRQIQWHQFGISCRASLLS